VMGKGSGRRPAGLVTDKKLQDNWDRIFGQKPNDKQFEGKQNGHKPNAANLKKIKG